MDYRLAQGMYGVQFSTKQKLEYAREEVFELENKLKEECKHTETPVFLGHISRNGVNLRFVKCVNCGYEWGQ